MRDIEADLMKHADGGTVRGPETMAKFFKYSHLPPFLQGFSSKFAELALFILDTLPRSAERTVALRKLLESKDAAVRSALP